MNLYLLALFVITQIVDAWLTWKILERGGVELNPFMAWLMENLGDLGALIIAKGIAVGFIGWLCIAWPEDKQLAFTMAFIITGYGVIINHNWKQKRGK